MREADERGVHLVLLAGEQVLPNLQSLLYRWRVKRDLAAVYIYHTAAHKQSKLPAQRLALLVERLIRQGWPPVQVHLSGPCGADPQSVGEQVERWRRAAGAESRWILNATGGLKSMALGLFQFAEAGWAEVVYQDVGDWFTVHRDERGGFLTRPTSEQAQASVLDQIAVQDLVETQYAIEDPSQVKVISTAVDADRDVVARTRELIRHGWQWSRVYGGHHTAKGFHFESYVGSLLDALGVANARLNLEIRVAGKKVNENDIVLCHGGQVTLLDLKLTAREKRTVNEQIRDAAHNGRALGGLNTNVIMLRPGWPLDVAVRTMAEMQPGRLQLWDQPCMGDFVGRLASLFDLPIQGPSAVVHELLMREATRGAALFERPRTAARASAGSNRPTPGPWTDLQMVVQDEMAHLDQPVRVAHGPSGDQLSIFLDQKAFGDFSAQQFSAWCTTLDERLADQHGTLTPWLSPRFAKVELILSRESVLIDRTRDELASRLVALSRTAEHSGGRLSMEQLFRATSGDWLKLRAVP